VGCNLYYLARNFFDRDVSPTIYLTQKVVAEEKTKFSTVDLQNRSRSAPTFFYEEMAEVAAIEFLTWPFSFKGLEYPLP
jgi:hypothetical protein